MERSLFASEAVVRVAQAALVVLLLGLSSAGVDAQEASSTDGTAASGGGQEFSPMAASPVTTTQLTDPITGQLFEAEVLLVTNGRGGYDSDGCPYSQGPQPRAYAIATSPYTLYSAPVESYGKGVPAKATGSLHQYLQQFADKEATSPLTPTRRYELAALAAEHLGEGPYAVGDYLLSAGWTVRDRIVGFLPAVQGASDAWEKLQGVLPDYRAVASPRGRTLASFDLARLSHRGGFGWERDALLAQLESFPDAGLGAFSKREEFRRLVRREHELLRAARSRFEEGLGMGLGSSEDRSYRRYLVGELSRRLGELERAGDELRAVANDTETSAEVLGVVRDILAVLQLQGATASALDLSWTNEAKEAP
ncbi:MAG TPA: hypothetical protein DIU15_03675 [Deltaproteobacteria bacterium]|nr:hypothetical protein [Deltaproteobacteria bacterium]HCP45113.1 hypothetical protein [Deltaproteobacteria bacterium]